MDKKLISGLSFKISIARQYPKNFLKIETSYK